MEHDAASDLSIVTVTGEADDSTAPLIDRALRRHGTPTTVVFDLSGLSFADSAMLHLMLHESVSSRVVVAGPLPVAIQRLFQATGTEGLFTIAPDIEAALRDL
ncbi:hypothetical protein B1H18_10870 [Streptomyces tsukubensis]|uniref:STAS domain-containing protein n=1 Tax=Streptomyces tsukubensis TaxID=83656 RepID=A0A1V4AC24_9ACTN|nr:hypothetical protein B1H18_10870 [Streptomyces tsukubensis]